MTDQKELNEEELRIGILRILEHQRKHSEDQPGGAAGKLLMELLGVEDVLDVERPLKWLIDNNHVEIGLRKFLISEKGREFLEKSLS